MLNLPWLISAVKYLFISGFVMSVLGSIFGIVRLAGICGLFEVIKPELKRFSPLQRRRVKKSFYHHNHWLTMARELINLNRSSRQLQGADNLAVPVISIKSQTFFQPSILTSLFPLKAIDQLRERMHRHFSTLADDFTEMAAPNSSHFVWTDQPEIMLQAIEQLLRHQ